MNKIRYLLACLALALSLPSAGQWGGVYSLRYASTPTDVASLITAPCATSAAVLYNAATPCSANLTFNPTGSLLTIGADVVVSRYAAKQLMISGDGVGATTNAGLILGYYGASGGAALWNGTAAPAGGNYALLTDGTANTYLNGVTTTNLHVNNISKFALTATLNTSTNPISITDATDSSSSTTGSLKTAGGLGVAKKLWVGDEATVIKAASSALNIRNSAETVGLATYLTFGSSTYNRAQLRSTASGTQGGDLSVFTAPSGANPIERVNISADGVTTFYGSVSLTKTITAPGTTGAQTINKSTGRVNFAAAATSLVVTNSLATANSICHVTKATNDSTMRLGACVAAAGTITIYADVAPAAEAAVNFTVTN